MYPEPDEALGLVAAGAGVGVWTGVTIGVGGGVGVGVRVGVGVATGVADGLVFTCADSTIGVGDGVAACGWVAAITTESPIKLPSPDQYLAPDRHPTTLQSSWLYNALKAQALSSAIRAKTC